MAQKAVSPISTSEFDREKMTVAVLLSLAVVPVVCGIFYVALGAIALGLISIGYGLISGAIFAAVPGVISHRVARSLMLWAQWLGSGVGIVATGGTESPIYYAALILPVCAGLVGGQRVAYRWAAMLVFLLGGLAGAQAYGQLPAPALDPKDLHVAIEWAIATGCTLLVLTVSSLQTRVHTRARTEALSALKAQHDAERIKARFIVNVSHELRTPMNGILGMIEVLEDGSIGAEDSEHLAMLSTSAKRLCDQIEDLLQIVHTQAGELRVKNVSFDPAHTTRISVESVRELAESKGLSVQVTSPPQMGTWSADRQLVRRCLLILLDNAVKFSHEGSVAINLVGGENSLRWDVSDSGPGVPEALQEKIFGEFYQRDTSMRRTADGLGLGLSNLRAMVDAAGGRYGVESFSGRKGSRFWFEFPATWIRDACEANHQTQPRPEPRREHQPDLGPARAEKPDLPAIEAPGSVSSTVVLIEDGNHESAEQPARKVVLLVEDDPINRKVLSRILRKLGYDSDTAENGEIAVKIADSDRHAFILMDCQMPVMDGLEATRQIRAKLGRDIAIIAVTAHSGATEVEACFVAGMNGHLSKPVSVRLLSEAIQTHIGDAKRSSNCAA